MPTAVIPSLPLLDSADVEDLLATILGKDLPIEIRARLRYLQRNGFPAAAVAGRGKRATYLLPDILQIVLAFELISLGLPPKRVIDTITAFWPELARSAVAAWRASRLIDGPETALQTDALRRIMLLEPDSLRSDRGVIGIGLARPSIVARMANSSGGDLHRTIAVDLLAVVNEVDAALRTRPFESERNAIDEAYETMGREHFGDRHVSNWRPPSDS